MGGTVFSVAAPRPVLSLCHSFHHAQGNHQHTGAPLKGIAVQSISLIRTQAGQVCAQCALPLADGKVQRMCLIYRLGTKLARTFGRCSLLSMGSTTLGCVATFRPVSKYNSELSLS